VGELVSSQANGSDPMIRANKLDLLERVADDLAHEIKNPLHSMVINLEVLKRRISRAQPEQSEEMLRYAGVLASELDRVTHRVDLLLRMIRPGRGDTTPLQETLDEVRELVEVEGSRRSVEVRFGAHALGTRAAAPREPARQVILNMVLAVLDTLAPGDSLTVRTERDEHEVRILVDANPAATPAGGEILTDVSAGRKCFDAAELLGGKLGGRLVEDHTRGALTLAFSLPAGR
jgi:signal transduction histidine kinase